MQFDRKSTLPSLLLQANISIPLKAPTMLKYGIIAAALMAAAVAGCDKPSPPVSEARPVRTVTVDHGAEGEIVSLTGQVRAMDEVSLSFRLDGRMIERPVRLGDALNTGQLVARLDPQI